MRTLRRFIENAERLGLSSFDINLLFGSLPADVMNEIMAEERVRYDDMRFAEGVGPFISAKPKRRPKKSNPAADPRPRIVDDWRRGTKALASIPAETYLGILVPESEPSRGKARCPLPDHEDRNPSATYSGAVWYCHRCGTGGGIFTLASALSGLGDRGDEFGDLRKWVARSLLGARA